MGASAVTRWPEVTKIRVMSPSTCGCSAEELRDFRVARYSVETAAGLASAVMVFTGNACGPAGWSALALFPQPAHAATTTMPMARNNVDLRAVLSMGETLIPLAYRIGLTPSRG